MATQAQLTPSLPPPHSSTQDQWSNQPADPSDKAEGKGEEGGGGVADSQEKGGGGGAAPE